MQDFVNIQTAAHPSPSSGLSVTPAPNQIPNPAAKAPAQGIEVTPRALDKIRSGMAKEGVSPTEGGLRLGILGGGCSGIDTSCCR